MGVAARNSVGALRRCKRPRHLGVRRPRSGVRRLYPNSLVSGAAGHPQTKSEEGAVTSTLADAVFLGLRKNPAIRSAYIDREAQRFDLKVGIGDSNRFLEIVDKRILPRRRSARITCDRLNFRPLSCSPCRVDWSD